MRVRSSWTGVILAGVLLLLWGRVNLTAQDQPTEDTTTYDDCRELEALMDAEATPYDYAFGGGALPFDTPQTGVLDADEWADYYTFRKLPGETTLTLNFSQSDAPFEVAVFWRERLVDGTTYQPTQNPADGSPAGAITFTLAAGEERLDATTEAPLPGAVYTVVVRRQHVTDPANTGVYTFSAALAAPDLLQPDVPLVRFREEHPNPDDLSLANTAASNPVDVTNVQGTTAQGGASLQRVRFNTGAQAFIHAESARTIQDLVTEREIIFTDAGAGGVGPQLGERDTAHYTAGGLGARWQGNDGPVVMYIQSFDYAAYANNIPALLRSGVQGAGGRWFLDTRYTDLANLYILDGCFGFELRATDGRGTRFIARLDTAYTQRGFRIDTPNIPAAQCPTADFTLVLEAQRPTATGDTEPINHNICLDWNGVQPGSTVRLDEANSLLSLDLIGERQLSIQSRNIRTLKRQFVDDFGDRNAVYGALFNQRGEPVGASYEPRNADDIDDNINRPLELIFDPLNPADGPPTVTVTLDWVNLAAFRYQTVQAPADLALCRDQPLKTPEPAPADAPDALPATDPAAAPACVVFEFSDDDTVRERTVRPAAGLATLTALDDVIHMVYGEDGEERLLLPEDETYIEIITPPTDAPTFDGAPFDANALPGTPGFAPRLGNNLGGECYPFPTLHPEANCAANGHPNPVNGNLWYAVTDHRASGYRLDLLLTRSYNSRARLTDGPFGPGWSTDFLLDYNVPYDPASAARPVEADAARLSPEGERLPTYRVGLDVTWAPRNMVVYTAPSGSRHVFVKDPAQPGFVFRSLTMPDWVVYRPNLRSDWTLRQADGYSLLFDRAGRLQSYGYGAEARAVSILYQANLKERVNGPAGYGISSAVLISDAFNQRRLELYYDDNHRVFRSVLRDIDARPDFRAACELSDNCYETLYQYNPATGLLEQVIYPDRQTATYTYDERGRLTAHDDPRAPVAQQMRYTYDEQDRLLTAEVVLDATDTAALPWRQLSYGADRTTTVTDDVGAARTYTFAPPNNNTAYAWNTTPTPFALARVNGPFAETTAYTWPNRLTIDARTFLLITTVNRAGRNLQYDYDPNTGALDRILDDGMVRYDRTDFGGGTQFAFDDGAPRTVRYDRNGFASVFFQPDGSIFTVNRYTDNDQRNWPERVFQYSAAPDFSLSNFTLYEYNAVGLVTDVIRGSIEDDIDPHLITYRYDGLGQLTRVFDLTLGAYTIENTVLLCAEAAICREVTVTDPQGAVTVYRYDGRGHLVERRLQAGRAGELLRQTTYTYDALGRLTGEYVRFDAASRGCTADQPDPLTSGCYLATSYTYRVDTAQQLLEVTQTDPEGRTQTHTYDALGRLQTVSAPGQPTTRYDYAGREVTRRTIYGDPNVAGAPEHAVSYRFDNKQRLELVRYLLDESSGDGGAAATPIWGFTHPAVNRLTGLTLRNQEGGQLISAASWNWTEDRNGDNWLIDGWDLTFGGDDDDLRFRLGDDGLGQLGLLQNQVGTDDEGNPIYENVQVTTCPADGDGVRVIYHRRAGADALPATCALVTDNVDAIYTYDVHGRLLEQVDEFGTRSFAYSPSATEAGRWRVIMTATAPDGDTTATWTLVYNFAGDLVRWTDETGVTRTYTYDLAGRLLSVTTGDETDEATFSFTYNRAGQVTQVSDRLGRGTAYTYDDAGRVATVTDLATGATTTATYDAFGRLLEAARTTSTGEALARFRYFYGDTDDDQATTNPTTLTQLTDEAGRTTRLRWAAALPTGYALTITDPNNQPTTYRLNGRGQLVRAEDAVGNVYTWAYGPDGALLRYTPPGVPSAGGPLAVVYTVDREPLLDADNLLQLTAQVGPRASWRAALQRTPLGLVTGLENQGSLSFAYNPLGQLAAVEVRDQLGAATYNWTLAHPQQQEAVQLTFTADGKPVYDYTLAYDPLGRLEAILSDERISVEVDYRARADGVNLTYSDGRVETYRREGDLVVFRAAGVVEVARYDGRGQLIAAGRATCEPGPTPGCAGAPADVLSQFVTVDPATGNRTAVTYADGTAEAFTYDVNDNLTGRTVTTPDGTQRAYAYTYNAANQLTSVTTPGGGRFQFFYRDGSDQGERVAAICAVPADAVTLWETLDACRRAGSVLEQYGYDALGRQTAQRFVTVTPPNLFDPISNAQTDDLLNVRGDEALQANNLRFSVFGGIAEAGRGDRYTYTEDGLNLVATRDTGTQRYAYEYAPRTYLSLNPDDTAVRLVRVTATPNGEGPTAADYGYTYEPDNPGRLLRFTVGDRTYDYTYGVGGAYTVTPANAPELAVTGLSLAAPSAPPQPTARNTGLVPVSDLQPLAAPFIDEDADRECLREGVTRTFGAAQVVTIDHTTRCDEGQGNITPRDGYRLPLLAQTIYTGPLTREVTNDRGDVEIEPVHIPAPSDSEVARVFTDSQGREIYRHRHRLFYSYDNAGNLTDVTYLGSLHADPGDQPWRVVLTPLACTRYEYDNANRLVAVFDGPTNTVISRYAYDMQDRLVALTTNGATYQFDYLNDARVPSFVVGPDGATRPVDPARALDGWAFDAQGRLLPLSGATPIVPAEALSPLEAAPADACRVGGAAQRPTFTPGDLLFDGMVLDPATGLGFIDGRAYLPGIGRFLQRDPHGPDENGYVYRYDGTPAREPLPWFAPRRGVAAGLETLAAARTLDPAANLPTVASILDDHLPRLDMRPVPVAALVDQQANATAREVRQYLELPYWLAHSYNLPGPVAQPGSGLLSWDPTRISGQHGSPWATPYDLRGPFWDRELPVGSALQQPDTLLPPLLDMRLTPFEGVRTSGPQVWQASPFGLNTALASGTPPRPIDPTRSPAVVEAWLLGPWHRPEANLAVIQVAEQVATQYQRNSLDWVNDKLNTGLPALPVMDPAAGR